MINHEISMSVFKFFSLKYGRITKEMFNSTRLTSLILTSFAYIYIYGMHVIKDSKAVTNSSAMMI